MPKLTQAHLITIIAAITPWLAPLPTAWLVYDRTLDHLHWPAWVAITAALIVEALGLVSTITALDLYTYNRTKRKSDPRAPVSLSYALVAAYLLTAELLTVGLDIAPKWGNLGLVDWTPAVFPLLSLAGMTLLAIRVDHSQRLEDVESAAQERKEQRMAARERRQERRQANPERTAAPLQTLTCPHDGCSWSLQWPTERHKSEQQAKAALAGHLRWCENGRREPMPERVL